MSALFFKYNNIENETPSYLNLDYVINFGLEPGAYITVSENINDEIIRTVVEWAVIAECRNNDKVLYAGSKEKCEKFLEHFRWFLNRHSLIANDPEEQK